MAVFFSAREMFSRTLGRNLREIVFSIVHTSYHFSRIFITRIFAARNSNNLNVRNMEMANPMR